MPNYAPAIRKIFEPQNARNLDEAAELSVSVGFRLFLWNGQIILAKKESGKIWYETTGLTIADIEVE